MKKGRWGSERGGTSLMEFTLVGIPMIFVLISVFELSRGMWIYQSLAAGVKAGTRYTIVHGEDCATSPNSCTVTIGQIATQIQNAGPGLMPDQLTLTFTPASGSAISESMTDALNDTTTWPPSANNANAAGQNVTISAVYPFSSVISMFWPGAASILPFTTVNFPAASKERIQY
jgi:Flp pilus assembly protein TadG